MATDESKNNFLIDGFPRNKDNLDGWTTEMGDKTNVRFVLFFDCDEQVHLSISYVLSYIYFNSNSIIPDVSLRLALSI